MTHRRAIRTTNLFERLFVEERRRLKINPNAFGERAVLKLMFGALIRAAERWRSVKVTEFEHRQIAAVRKELDQESDAQVGLKKQPSKEAALDGLGIIGGFGTGSKLMWDAMGGLGYAFTESSSIVIGYRGLSVDSRNDGFVFDVTQHGPIIGAVFKF